MTDMIEKKGLPLAFTVTGALSAVFTVFLIYSKSPDWMLAALVWGTVLLYSIFIGIKKEKNQNDADSIYYLGFGLTIISLAVSSYVHFGSSAKFDLNNLKLVFSQFAIGLIATCFGLIGRLIVVAKLDDTKINETDDTEKRRELVLSLGELRREVVGFAGQLNDLNKDLRKQQLELHAETIQRMKEAHQQALAENAQATQSAIGQMSKMVESLMQQQVSLQTQAYAGLAELSQKTHAQITSLDFVTISQKTNQAVSQLAVSCANFATQTAEAQQVMQTSSHHLEQHSRLAAQNLSGVVHSLEGLTQSTQGYNAQVQRSTQALDQTTEQLTESGRAAQQVLEAINQQYQQYGQANERYLKGCDDILSHAASTTKQLVQSAGHVGDSVLKVESALEIVAKKSIDIAQKFRDSARS